ncbi:MAG: amidohydrolase family protein [Christensenellales bacterium]
MTRCFTLHASEMDYEMKFFAERGETPTRYLEKIGAVNERLLAGHCIHMTQADIEILAEGNAAIAHCIGSNTKAGKGVAPMAAAARAGVRFGLGTDGPSSGNTLSLFDQMRLFADAHKTANRDRALFPAKKLCAATRGGAQLCTPGTNWGSSVPVCMDMVLVSGMRRNVPGL